jgi:hypothetical protein
LSDTFLVADALLFGQFERKGHATCKQKIHAKVLTLKGFNSAGSKAMMMTNTQLIKLNRLKNSFKVLYFPSR